MPSIDKITIKKRDLLSKDGEFHLNILGYLTNTKRATLSDEIVFVTCRRFLCSLSSDCWRLTPILLCHQRKDHLSKCGAQAEPACSRAWTIRTRPYCLVAKRESRRRGPALRQAAPQDRKRPRPAPRARPKHSKHIERGGARGRASRSSWSNGLARRRGCAPHRADDKSIVLSWCTSRRRPCLSPWVRGALG